MIKSLSKDCDLVYSEDEDGWYIQDFKNDRVSILYNTESEARQAFREKTIQWEWA